MTSWSVSIDAALSSSMNSLEDAVDQLLSLLEADDTIVGPVAYLNAIDQTFGARFSLDAATMQAAIDQAIVRFSQSAQRLGFSFELRGGSVAAEDLMVFDHRTEAVASI